jgi:chromosome segregation protein
MRLRKIKLSGFKSFVDPTTLAVPGNLIGIVGPNGCGKSNIIDAVTWVMGESSAKHLRGESLTDVIFNGSNTRQPVSQALVELIFDNSEGKAGGQYSSYNEISIKRQMNREGISVYYLNGTRCRRKDIHGIFLGTGLGPRGYSIIEQGMISRLIEAKPEELRVYVEEAAGISKYREKRKETENRMVHTRENLSRLNDIREELNKQLNHLQRQAKAAEKFQVLKEEERKLRSELLAINYRDLNSEVEKRQTKVREQKNRVEEHIAIVRKIEGEIESHRSGLSVANDTLNQVQSDYYQVGGDISQLEQKLEYSNEKIAGLSDDIEKNEAAIKETKDQILTDENKYQELVKKIASLEPELDGSRSQSTLAYDSLNQAEKSMQTWQGEWDAFKEEDAELKQKIEVCNARINHVNDSLEEIDSRKRSLAQELEEVKLRHESGELGKLGEILNAKQIEMEQSKQDLDASVNNVRASNEKVIQIKEKVSDTRTAQQIIEGTLATLLSLQHGNDDDGKEINDWLSRVGIQDPQRLYEDIDVDPNWTHAVETVLGQYLQSVVVKDFENTVRELESITNGQLSLVSNAKAIAETTNNNSLPRLIDKVRSNETAIDHIIGNVYIAENISQALTQYPSLGINESVITQTGVWIGNGWVRVNRRNEEESVLLREQKIQSLKSENDALLNNISNLQSQYDETAIELQEAEESHDTAEHKLVAIQDEYNQLQSQHAEIRGKNQTSESRIEQINDDMELSLQREESSHKDISNYQSMLEDANKRLSDLETRKESLTSQRQKHEGLLDTARNSWQNMHEQSHEIALQLEALSSQKASLEQSIKRTGTQIESFEEQNKVLHENLSATRQPIDDLKKNLDAKLELRIETEKRLAQSRESVQQIEIKIRESDQSRVLAEQNVDEHRTDLEKLKLDSQEVKVRLQTVIEQLQESNQQAEKILSNLDENANKEEWQETLNKAEQKIQRLGPINLAAIEEYNQLNERKEYLDRQNDDLEKALTTLENAIQKIDKESRTRFKETFDHLNTNLKEMFPVLFGGGHASLEMTGNDLLDTGIAIMARPPGKKNSSIHLLSGGEKALTAVALVFAIFKLNPAPFCILDEVDAPLDDTNTGRFSELVAQMSTDVQFLVITHNKITMEIAHQLLGVTMHEPGVSRLVSVDIDEAIEMAASA